MYWGSCVYITFVYRFTICFDSLYRDTQSKVPGKDTCQHTSFIKQILVLILPLFLKVHPIQ